MDRIAVLIPCYNEGRAIRKVVTDWHNALPEAVIYVYDNNSTDDTVAEAASAGAIVVKEKKQGKGNVVRSMFQDIDAECYLMVDGDDTYSPENARIMSDLVLNEKVDMVIGDRLSSTYFQETTRRFHGFGNILVRKCINTIFKSVIKDVMTGCRAFSRRFVKTFPIVSKGFEIETEMTIHALDKNLNIETVSVEYKERDIPTESKLRTIPDGIKVLRTIFNMFKDYQPMMFFSLFSLFLFLIGTAFFLPVLNAYFKTGLVDKFPTLIVCCFVYLSAIISFFSGMILDVIHKKERREFEYRLLGRRY